MSRVPYRYGASFVDEATGLRFEAHHPAIRPDRWTAYIEGAVREYERYGIAHLIDRRALERADNVSLFFVGVDEHDHVVAGLRCHGPLDDAHAAYALAEMAGSPEIDEHRGAVEAAAAYGVLEMKGAWRELSGDGNHVVVGPMSRCVVHALEWFGAEIMLTALAERLEGYLAGLGGVKLGAESSPFPSEKYRTILVAFRRARYGVLADPVHAKLIRRESEQLRHPLPPGTATGWRPLVLDVRRRADREILANLRTDPATETIDLADRQSAELRRLLPPPDRSLIDEQPRHVYYPWRRTVVRMLGPQAFRTVRLDRNRNRITRDEQRRLQDQRVGVVGLSAGHSAAATIALEGLCGELRLADFDDVELSNLNRLPASVLDVGVNKAVVAARRVAEIDPYMDVRIAPEGLTPANVEEFVAGLDVLVEECDEIAMKLLVREVARRQRVAVVMETSDRGLLDVERFDEEADRPIFHGLLDDTTAESVSALSDIEKLPHVLRIVDPSAASARGAASLAEIGRTLSTWPQLGGDVTLGGATVAATVRRLGLGEPVPSGRIRVDLETLVSSLESPIGAADAAEDRAMDAPPPSRAPVPTDPFLAIAHAATLAPSGGNAQPWRLGLSDDRLSFEVEGSRTSTMDVRSRASLLALGAAVFNARVAAAASGMLGPVAYFPEGPASRVAAALDFGEQEDAELAALYPAMLARCANRRRGTPDPLDLAITGRLSDAARAEGGTLHLVTDRDRLDVLAEILGASERIRFLHPVLHAEMMGELRWPHEDASTGIDVRTLELSGMEFSTLDIVRRADVMELLGRWDAGQALGDSARRSVHLSSALAVVTVANATPTSYLHGGSAVERLWICAQEAGLAVQPLSPVFLFAVQQADFDHLGGERWSSELRSLAAQFRDVVDLGSATVMALVLRLSHAPPATARSIRLPLQAVLQRRTTLHGS